ncbi:unnamed protein product [Effrenium voratum]|uniref:Uncharacterized protein n=1 Tax=Effrenium voratum TaxID=2562239 RepID=A0AA36MZR7_9DINO|nr:unnamed protein product [Effrenium voratum]
MPMPSDEAKVVEVPAKTEKKSKSSVIGRVADYLPQRLVGKTGNKKTPDGVLSSCVSVVTGRFLVLTDNIVMEDKGASSSARENLVNECTNMGLISALMLTIVVPMAFDNVTDWLEEDYVGSGFAYLDGWIGQQQGEDSVQSTMPAIHDLSLICYVLSSLGYLCSTIVSVIGLLCVGEIETDTGVEEFLRNIGSGTRIPYLFWWNGAFFVIPCAVRFTLSCKTLGGLIVMCLIELILLILVSCGSVHWVRSCISGHNTVHEFEELQLSLQEAEEDVNAWFAHNQNPGALQDCLLDLAGLSDGKVMISMDTVSQQRVAMCFHKKHAEVIGVPLSPPDLYRMAYHVSPQ